MYQAKSFLWWSAVTLRAFLATKNIIWRIFRFPGNNKLSEMNVLGEVDLTDTFHITPCSQPHYSPGQVDKSWRSCLQGNILEHVCLMSPLKDMLLVPYRTALLMQLQWASTAYVFESLTRKHVRFHSKIWFIDFLMEKYLRLAFDQLGYHRHPS